MTSSKMGESMGKSSGYMGFFFGNYTVSDGKVLPEAMNG
jgi:hypothetical protein